MTASLSYLRQATGRLLGIGDVAMVTGVPSGGFSTTGFQCSSLALDEDSFYLDWYLRIFAGTHKDITRRATASLKANGAITFSPAVTGNIDATDLFELHRDFSPEEINNAINLAISMVGTDALQDKVDESLIADDILTDGLFESWISSSALTYWSKGGTGSLTREDTIKLEGSYSACLFSAAGIDFWIYQSKGNPGLFSGQAASLYAWVKTTAANKVRIRLYDGVNTWNSDYHDGKGWLKLSIENATLSTALTELTVTVLVGAGAVVAYVDRMWLVSGNKIYEYPIPTGFYTIETITPESSTLGQFNIADRLDPKRWQILGAGTKKIWFKDALTAGRKLRLEGQGSPGQLTLDADTTEVPMSYVVQQAKAILHQGRITGTGGVAERHDLQMRLAQSLAERERRDLLVSPRGQKV